MHHIYISFFLAIYLLLSACTGFQERPPIKDGVDVALIQDPVPRSEPRSRYGNPESYVQNGERYWIMPDAKGFVERGKASWYGKKFDGKRTSSGETYDMYAMTAAHKTLPLPTYVEVTNLSNQRKVVLRVNDRGPFKKGRIIDLSYTAAKKLGIVAQGTAPVEIKVLDPEKLQTKVSQAETTAAQTIALPSASSSSNPRKVIRLEPPTSIIEKEKTTDNEIEQKPNNGQVYIQVGAYAKIESANAVIEDLRSLGKQTLSIAPIKSAMGVLHRVRIGPFSSEHEANPLLPVLRKRGYYQYRLVQP